MTTRSELLWASNNEYRKRLSLLMGHFRLLSKILEAQPQDVGPLPQIWDILEDIDADQHNWRHTYYYREDGLTKRRIVTDPDAIENALFTFSRMMNKHLRHYDALLSLINSIPRPEPTLTRVINDGDLWDMCLEELASLAQFDTFVQEHTESNR